MNRELFDHRLTLRIAIVMLIAAVLVRSGAMDWLKSRLITGEPSAPPLITKQQNEGR